MTHPQPDGFLAVPKTGTAPGVLVLHAWWGLNDTFKAVCRRLAHAGYTAFAPDLYHGKVAHTIAEAEVLGNALDANHRQAAAEVAQAARFLAERTGAGLAVIGFSLGGFYALQLAAAEPAAIRAVVLFYGTEGTMGSDFSPSRASYLGHFAENDPYETPANIALLEASLRRAGRPLKFHTYAGTSHWFFEPDRAEAYHPAAAKLAWRRTLAFLRATLPPPASR